MNEQFEKERYEFISKISFTIGMIHGGIDTILRSPSASWEKQLVNLKKTLDERVSMVYYNQDIRS